jgi:hypothetical protein
MSTSTLARPMRTLLLAGLALAAWPAGAAGQAEAADRLARYQQERAVCTSGRSNQDRGTCLREAGASYAEAQRGGLGDSSAPYAANASQRCARLPEDDRLDCAARMKGQGSRSGSVAGGGIYRELTTREVTLPAKATTAPPDATVKAVP